MSLHRHFNETQRFTQWWLWLIIIGVQAVVLISLYAEHFTEQQVASQPIPFWAVILIAATTLGVLVLFIIMRLETRIDRSGVGIRYLPFLSRHYLWEHITHAEVVNYGFVGGWGIRLGTKYGTVYNVKGNIGLHLKLKNGKQVCIGTQKAEALKQVLKNFEIKMDAS